MIQVVLVVLVGAIVYLLSRVRSMERRMRQQWVTFNKRLEETVSADDVFDMLQGDDAETKKVSGDSAEQTAE
jgi:hypothetical protein